MGLPKVILQIKKYFFHEIKTKKENRNTKQKAFFIDKKIIIKSVHNNLSKRKIQLYGLYYSNY